METKEENHNDQKQHNKVVHCLILPYPIQGHINLILQFAKRLYQNGITTSLVLTKQLLNTKMTLLSSSSSASISVETISDGHDDRSPPSVSSTTEFEAYLATFSQVGPETLKQLVARLVDSGRPMRCIVYDPFMPWVLNVVKELGIVAVAFLTQPCSVDYIFYQVFKGVLEVPLVIPAQDDEILLLGLPLLKPQDMPSWISDYGSFFKMSIDQFRGIEEGADWIFLNMFHKLEEEVIDYMSEFLPVKTIGPTVPSTFLDKRLPDDIAYGLNIYKPVTGACMEWLNKQRPKSVVYVSLGSLAQLGEEQMEELAWGLKLSNKNFLWVVRSSEESKLPKDFAKETSEKGLIVSWCPQLHILAHEAVCCFLTHCGWNSTLEALSLGVPIVATPPWSN